MKREKFLEKARNIHGYDYDYPDLPKNVYQNDYIDVVFDNILYKQRVLKHLKGSRPEKKTHPKSTEEFINLANSIWCYKYDYSMCEYINARTKVKIIYDGIIYEQLPGSHLKYPCEGFLSQSVFIEKARKKWKDKYDYSLVNFTTANDKVKIILDGIVYDQTPHNHLKYAPEKKLSKRTNETFISLANEIHDKKYTYENVDYKNDRSKVFITCPVHGDFDQSPNAHLRGQGCPSCRESYGEKEIAKFLNNYDVLFERQKKFPDCRDESHLRFDFYLPKFRTCIAFDGIQHSEPLSCFGGTKAFFKLQKRDKIKNNYCEENFINLIRIKYDQENIIWELLWDNLKLFINK